MHTAVVINIYKYKLLLLFTKALSIKCLMNYERENQKLLYIHKLNSPKNTCTLNTSAAHPPSFLRGETCSLKLVREKKFPHKSDLVCPLVGDWQRCLHTEKHNPPKKLTHGCQICASLSVIRSQPPMHVTIGQTKVCVMHPGVGQTD